VIFAVGIVGMIIIFGIGFSFGKPEKLIYPIAGNEFCGLKEDNYDNRDKPYLKVPNFPSFDESECIDKCPVDTIDVLWRCIPNITEKLEDSAVFQQFSDAFSIAVNDIQQGWWLFFVAFGITVVLIFLFFLCFQCCVKIIIWAIIILSILLILAVGIWVLVYGIKNYSNPLKTDKTSRYKLS
jgi:hypothetical protein